MSLLQITQLEHLAKLAKIKLSEEEKKLYAKDLAGILDYVGKLNEIDQLTTKVILENSQLNQLPESLKSALRSDEVLGISDEEQAEMINLFPEKDGRLIKTKPVF
jgi:aspartyl-tRNA(Asn)/glutamyl-tRNA(Gln) amidotransferase subunit C